MATLVRRRKKKNNYYQGVYEVVNKEKYLGTKNPRFLSSYELKLFRRFDLHPAIIEWGAETVVVPYYNPVKQRKCKYLVDVYAKYQTRSGEIRIELIEIKPSNQCSPPVATRGKRKDVLAQQNATYIQNQAKWEAATKYAEDRGWTFRVMTEKNLFI